MVARASSRRQAELTDADTGQDADRTDRTGHRQDTSGTQARHRQDRQEAEKTQDKEQTQDKTQTILGNADPRLLTETFQIGNQLRKTKKLPVHVVSPKYPWTSGTNWQGTLPPTWPPLQDPPGTPRNLDVEPVPSSCQSPSKNVRCRAVLRSRKGAPDPFPKATDKPQCLPCICSVSCAQSMTLNHQCAMLKTSVLHKYDEWMVSNTHSFEGENLPPPRRLSASSTQHCRRCLINAFKKQFVLWLRDPHLLEVDLVHNLPVSTFVEAWPKPTQ